MDIDLNATFPSGLTAACRAPVKGVLLTMGGYHGTLAAARELGSHGVTVVLAEAQPDTITGASRYVSRRLGCPSVYEHAAFMAWLLEFGQAEPGFVLYPTSDELCWLLDRHHDALAGLFYLYQPAQRGLYPLLNKQQLYRHCGALGITCPPLWQALPGQTQAEFLASVHYPVLVKPQTQAGLRVQIKGLQALTPDELAAALDPSQSPLAYRPEMLQDDPGLTVPMVQQFYPEAAANIYSLAGFYAPETGTFLVRASMKVLQKPLNFGVGLCFESCEVREDLKNQLQQLMDRVAYKGVFEVEFIHLKPEDRFLLIDFNTRFYGQMGFEIARGIPMARLCYHAAQQDWPAVRHLADQAMAADTSANWRCCHGWKLRLYATTLWLGGVLSWRAWRKWLRWPTQGPCHDPIYAADDPRPARLFKKKILLDMLRYPRSSFKTYFNP